MCFFQHANCLVCSIDSVNLCNLTGNLTKSYAYTLPFEIENKCLLLFYAGGGSGSVLGVLQEAHTQMSNTGSSSSTTSSIHHNYGFDRVEICIEDAIEVDSESNQSESHHNPEKLKPSSVGCCNFCKSHMCRNWKWRLKATFGGLTER